MGDVTIDGKSTGMCRLLSEEIPIYFPSRDFINWS